MPKNSTFKRVNLCHTGDFGTKTDKIAGWITAHGGVYSKDITTDVTHLVCSDTAWKKKNSYVRNAQRHRGLKIVKYDWLEDSLLSKSERPKKEDQYLWESAEKKKRKRNHTQKATGDSTTDAPQRHGKLAEIVKVFEKGCTDFEKYLYTEGHHIYTDTDNFPYSVVLAKPCLLDNRVERHHLKVRVFAYQTPACSTHGTSIAPTTSSSSATYFPSHASFRTPSPLPLYIFPSSPTLPYVLIPDSIPRHARARAPIVRPLAQCMQLYESSTTPPTYCAYVVYRSGVPGKPVGKDLLAPVGSHFDIAFSAWKAFFKAKTGKLWEDRFDGKVAPLKTDKATGLILQGSEGVRFRYMPPWESGVEPAPVSTDGITIDQTNARKGQTGSQDDNGSVVMVLPKGDYVVEDTGFDNTIRVPTPESGW